MKDYKIAVTILLGIALAIVTVVFVGIVIGTRPPELSQEKMQKNAEEAQKAEKKHTENSQSEEEREEEEGHTKELEDFDVTAILDTEADNRICGIGKICYV